MVSWATVNILKSTFIRVPSAATPAHQSLVAPHMYRTSTAHKILPCTRFTGQRIGTLISPVSYMRATRTWPTLPVADYDPKASRSMRPYRTPQLPARRSYLLIPLLDKFNHLTRRTSVIKSRPFPRPRRHLGLSPLALAGPSNWPCGKRVLHLVQRDEYTQRRVICI